MQRKILTTATLAAVMLCASSAEAGPIRNAVKRVASGVRNVASRATDVLPFGVCWRKRAQRACAQSQVNVQDCASGQCQK